MPENATQKRQGLWQVYCKRNEPMPGLEIRGSASPRGNRVLKAKDLSDKIKFPPLRWWETSEWESFCTPKSNFSTLGQSINQIIEQAFARNMLRYKKPR